MAKVGGLSLSKRNLLTIFAWGRQAAFHGRQPVIKRGANHIGSVADPTLALHF